MASSQAIPSEVDQRTPWYIIGGLTLAIVVAYFNTLKIVAVRWTDDQYSHGFLVPIFAAVLIAMLRRTVSTSLDSSGAGGESLFSGRVCCFVWRPPICIRLLQMRSRLFRH